MEMKKKLPIGIEEFEKIREEGFYYIDKTGLIKELLYNWGEVNLFTRPRRFGKSLNMSMLKCFFEIGGKRELFDGLQIADEKELCDKYMGKFPVVSISLKGVSGDSFETARSMMCCVIGKEALRFRFLLDSKRLSSEEKMMYSQLIMIDSKYAQIFQMSDSVLAESFRTLTMLLEKHYGQAVIVLIDEYDVPLAKAFDNQYYEQMVLLLHNLFERALKTNKSLYLAVLTITIEIDEEEIGIIIEVKDSDSGDLEAGCEQALKQIRSMQYEDQLRDQGMKRILKYGIACYKKHCRVVIENHM